MEKNLNFHINFFNMKEKGISLKFNDQIDNEYDVIIESISSLIANEFHSNMIPLSGIIFDGEDILAEKWKCWTNKDEEYCNLFDKKFDKTDDYIFIKRIDLSK